MPTLSFTGYIKGCRCMAYLCHRSGNVNIESNVLSYSPNLVAHGKTVEEATANFEAVLEAERVRREEIAAKRQGEIEALAALGFNQVHGILAGECK